EVIEREEFERRRKEVAQTQRGLTQQLRQLDAQAQQHINVAALAQGIETFCQRMQPTLDNLTFAQRRQLVEWLIDRVIVNDTQVEIRYVVPTSPKGETTPFCHLRLDYLNIESQSVFLQGCHLGGFITDDRPIRVRAQRPSNRQMPRTKICAREPHAMPKSR